LLAGLASIPGVRINGSADPERQLDGVVNASFDCVSAGPLVLWMDRHGVAVSAGSACSSAGKHPSAVLMAMGRSEEEAMSAIRFSLGAKNTLEEVDQALDVLRKGVQKLRELDIVGSVRYADM
jgi:cysteine desulfurase